MNQLKRKIPRSILLALAPLSDRMINLACDTGIIADPQEMNICGVSAKFRVTSASERWRVQQYMGEEKILKAILSQIEEGDCFWDIGAAVGTYACLAAAAGAYSIAFEPHPKNHARCLENIELNDSNAEVRNVALSDSDGSLTMAEDRGVGSGMHRISNNGSITVPVSRGDDIDAHDPDIVKIDVEGHEIQVLDGLKTRLNSARLVFVEYHPEFDVSKEAVRNRLVDSGFTVSIRELNRNEKYLIGVKDR